MKILISGCCGFVGRHFTRRLVDDGHDVIGIDNMSAGIYPADWVFKPKRPIHEWKFYYADVREWARKYKPDYDLIIHCAAVVGGRLKIDGDPLAVATDLAIDADLYQWLAKHRFKGKLVYFSSSAVYPIELQTAATHLPLHESMVDLKVNRIGMPDQTYGWAKLTGELLARHADITYGIDTAVYRPFSGYGEDQDLSYPFPAIMRRIAQQQNPVEVWGPGTQARDFIHIDDVVECVLQTYVKVRGEPLNIGTGRPTDFQSLIWMAAEIAGYHAEVKPDTLKPAGVHYRVSDPYRMSQHYLPKISLEEGIRRSLDFHRTRL